MENAIEIKNLTKDYPGRVALKDVTFNVKKGSVHGFLGPNGAGKSTTMKILSGLIKETSGEVKVQGQIGFLAEIPPVYKEMLVIDYLNFVYDIYAKDSKNKKTNIQKVVERTGLESVQQRLIGNLSKGYQQRVGIAQALVHSPEIIILDEPTVGLDPVAIAEIRKLINDLKKEHTILFSSHQLNEVEQLCSEITLINKGEVVISGKMDEILSSLKAQMQLKLKVKKFDNEIENDLKKQFNLSDIIIKKEEDKDEIEICITINDKKDLRANIAKFLVENKCELLEFVEVKSELEDLFKRI